MVVASQVLPTSVFIWFGIVLPDEPTCSADEIEPDQLAPIVGIRALLSKGNREDQTGFRPDNMDYKWFIFYEHERLYIHRSWTGYCIYIVRFESNGRDYVACEVQVNRNPKQYGVSDDSYGVQLAFWVIDIALLGRDTGMLVSPDPS